MLRSFFKKSAMVYVATAAIAVASAARADFFVAVDGSDLNPGTVALPFATITRARDAVRTLVASGLTEDVRVVIGGGTYRLTEPIVLGVQDSGTLTFSVSYEAEVGQQPVISGGRVITGFSVNPDGTWSTVIPEVAAGTWTFRELFVDGQRRPRARHPNGNVANRIESAAPDQRTTFQFFEGDIPASTNLSGAELVFFHDWSISRIGISGVDHATNTLTTTDPIGPAAPIFDITFFENNPRYYVENDIALLDAPGEWYLDELTGTLTYKPVDGETPASIEFVAPVSEQLLIVQGVFESATMSPQFVRNVHFRGLAFEHSAWPLPVGGFAEYQAGFYEPRDGTPFYDLPAAVVIEQADNCSFTGGRIAHIGGWGIMAGRTAQNCSIVGNAITDIAGNGIIVGEDQFRNIRNINDVALGQWWILEPTQAARDNVVRNNLVEHCGKVFHGCVGIWVGLAHDNAVSNNLIRYITWTGISVGTIFNDTVSPCHDNAITFNHIHDVMRLLSDGAGIYTLGRQNGTLLGNNIIHEIPLNQGVSSSTGIFLDQGSTEIVLDQNAIFSVIRPPMKVNIAGINTVRNNTFIRSTDSIPYILYSNTPQGILTLENNDFTTQAGPIRCDHSVYSVTPTAGLGLAYLTPLLGPPIDDGCTSCAGVPYSGQFFDSCDVCQGNGLTCLGIPTMSNWATVIFTLLLMTAATLVFSRSRRTTVES